MTGDQHSWGEYSRLVLKELETLAQSIQQLQLQIQDLKTEIAELKAREDKVDELRSWKEKIDEITSPTQLRTKIEEVEDLKMFKAKAITIFGVVQIMMAGMMAFLKFIL